MPTPLDLAVGQSTWTVTVPPDRLIPVRRADVSPRPSAGPRELVRDALERPWGFEPLRRALTPDDHVAVVLDERLPHVAELVSGVLDHLGTAGISPERVTILTPPPAGPATWIDDLPDEFADVRTEVHDPADRRKLAYLATTKGGRRLYLNRTLVDADFPVIVSGRGYDPVAGYGGAESAIFPVLSDDETRQAFAGAYSLDPPAASAPTAARTEATEAAWLLGTPFFVQVIEGAGDDVIEVVAGLPDSGAEGGRRQDAHWRGTVPRAADTVIAAVSGDPGRLSFTAFARAVGCAARVVKPGGRIALLTDASPPFPEAVDRLRGAADPGKAARQLLKHKPPDAADALQWCHAAKTASVFLASRYGADTAEELFATAIATPTELQRLVDAGGDVIVIPDAHKTLLTIDDG